MSITGRSLINLFLVLLLMIAPRGIDGTSHTDGISVSSYNFGGKYTKGMMIAQDDENLDGEELKNQNFKIIPFKQVLKALK